MKTAQYGGQDHNANAHGSESELWVGRHLQPGDNEVIFQHLKVTICWGYPCCSPPHTHTYTLWKPEDATSINTPSLTQPHWSGAKRNWGQRGRKSCKAVWNVLLFDVSNKQLYFYSTIHTLGDSKSATVFKRRIKNYTDLQYCRFAAAWSCNTLSPGLVLTRSASRSPIPDVLSVREGFVWH